MPLLSLSGVKKFYGRQDVLRQANLTVNSGEKIGLIGSNGAGKTTLLRIILGQESPDEGQVLKAKRLRLGYLPQDLLTFSGQTLLDMVMDTAAQIRAIEAELEYLSGEIEAAVDEGSAEEEVLAELTTRQGNLLSLYEDLGGWQLEAEAKKILTGLGFGEKDFPRPIDEYSGGWIMRAVLARLLLARPDLLLLDEPTNHLDMESLIWLESYLWSSTSAVLLVSHDRIFLNNVVKKIIEVDRGQTYTYAGNYNQYLTEREKRLATETAAYLNQQDRIKQVERFIERNRVRASTARLAQSRIKMLEKMDKVEAPQSSVQTINLSLPKAARGPEVLVQLAGVTKAFGSQVVYRDLDLIVRRKDRLAFLGPNGQGKTTLMKLLAGLTDFQAGTRRMGEGVVVSYFAQFQLEELNPNRTVIDELGSAAGDLSPGRLRSILAGFLFKDEDVFKKVAVLSGGEKSRLILAKIMMIGPNLLLLDEPTNHLDIPAREVLEKALRDYDGTLCLITHDRHLINSVAEKVLVINDGRVEVFPGNFDDYHEFWLARLSAEAGPAAESRTESTETTDSGRVVESRGQREARKRAEAEARQRLYILKAPLAAELERLEADQARLIVRREEITLILSTSETYQDAGKARELSQELAHLRAEIEQITASWEKTALQLEEIEAGFADDGTASN